MRILPVQMRVFAAEESERFKSRNKRRLRQHFTELAGWSDDALLDLIDESMRRAEVYGLDNDYDIALFIGAVAHMGRDFERNGAFSWARDILTNPFMDARTKMTRLYMHFEDESG